MRPNDPVFRPHLPAPPSSSSSSCLFPRAASYLSYPCRSPYEQPPLVKVEHKSFYPGGPVQVRTRSLLFVIFEKIAAKYFVSLGILIMKQWFVTQKLFSAVSSNISFLPAEDNFFSSSYPLHCRLHPCLNPYSSSATLTCRYTCSGYVPA